ncbi:hypothetical protein WN51_00039 [Melipona quadrifasciata]|uniref:Uncharacterized protein n=1 Tax=Melipona quadrifasciata TaxID=166423 RepID=A0A0M8ZMS5_9HYME|nr:hypothetical protein WN51_00039 [Melipona quadrifasciata]
MTIPAGKYSDDSRAIKIGDYVVVKIEDANSNSLMATPLYHSSITEYAFSSVS